MHTNVCSSKDLQCRNAHVFKSVPNLDLSIILKVNPLILQLSFYYYRMEDIRNKIKENGAKITLAL